MSDRTILDALDLLQNAYPHESVLIQARYHTDSPDVQFTAGVGVGGSDSNPVFAWAGSATQAAERLIAKAGDRNPVTLLDAKIAKLRAELAELEAAQQPAPVGESL